MSRNPFLDLGFSPEEATALHIRSQLAATLEQYLEHKGWDQQRSLRPASNGCNRRRYRES